jgi:hypothetical protein
MRRACAASVVLVLAGAAARAQTAILADGLEPGAPSSWSAAAGWSCADGDAPVAGNLLVEEAGTGGCPAGMLRVDTFCVDRYEASLAVILPGGGLAPWSPYVAPNGASVRALSVRLATPQGYVDQPTASAACQSSGKRLCTDSEWLRACRGPSSWVYPWGNDAQAGRCNDARAVSPVVEYYGPEPASWDVNQPCLNQLPATLERAGARSGCTSAEGPADMMGNLLEWTAEPAGTLRGGYYFDTQVNGPGCNYAATANAASHRAFYTGFRCCANPE